MKKLLTALLFTAFGTGLASAKTYEVAFDGASLDINGYVNFDQTGTFDLATFASLVGSFEITASENGASAFTFTEANSTWGRAGIYGTAVNVEVTAEKISMWAPTPGIGVSDAITFFLIANVPTNGALENLRMYADSVEFRKPAPSPDNVKEFVPNYKFTAVASAVPEPSTALTLMLGLGLLAWRVRRS